MWASTVWGFVNLAFSESDPSWKAWFIGAAILTAIAYGVWHAFRLIKKHRSGNQSTLDVTACYDMPISKAIDFIVNDSTQRLKRSSPSRIAEFGPAKGHLIIERGAEHSDALRLLEEKVISGGLRIWGRREYPPINDHPNGNFESIMREIEKDYWRNGRLDYFYCFHESARPQTAVLEANGLRYTGLTLNSRQVRQFWKPKFPLLKFIEHKILRRPRLSYWPVPGALSPK